MNALIEELKTEYEDAARALHAAVKREYPIGARVRVIQPDLNRDFQAEVRHHSGAWWSDPSGITIVNVKTNRLSKVDVATKSTTVEVLP